MNNGVFYSHKEGIRRNAKLSWYSVLSTVGVSLMVVVTLSYAMGILNKKFTQTASPDTDGVVLSLADDLLSVTIAEARAADNAYDRSAYYASNTDVFNGSERHYYAPVTSTVSSAPTKVVAQSIPRGTTAMRLIQSATMLDLAPLEKATFEIGIKNTSSTTWEAGTSMRIRSSAMRESYFYTNAWDSGVWAVSLKKSVAPGEITYFSFPVEAPSRTGEYHETFTLYAHGVAVANTKTDVSMRVRNKVAPRVKAATAPVVVSTPVEKEIVSAPVAAVPVVTSEVISPAVASGTTSGLRLIQNVQSLSLGTLQSGVFEIGFKNTGTTTWTTSGSDAVRLRATGRVESYFAHSSWKSGVWVKGFDSDVKPGEIAYVKFTLEAPNRVGNYAETFTLYRGDTPIMGAQTVLPVTVGKQAVASAVTTISPVSQSETPSTTTTPTIPSTSTVVTLPQALGAIQTLNEAEPTIRVGIVWTTNPVQITADRPFEVQDGSGVVLASLSAGEIATTVYDFATGVYTLSTPQGVMTTTTYHRFVGAGTVANTLPDQDVVFEVLSYENRPGWNASLNDNKFRAAMEVRYSEVADRLWVINELTLEHYLRGLAETSNASAYEYQKALVTAARTYAKYHIEHSTKYRGQNITVRDTAHDQVYRGYNSEIRMPNLSRAVDETRGQIVTYNGELAITPYYSRSDGRTRAWSEVWGGSKPWLLSVADPCCTMSTMWGHGVGMSAQGALYFAREGNNYESILRHYYTDTRLSRIYQ